MIQPKDVEIDGKIYVICKLPAIEGREIITQYPTTGAPVIGNYPANRDLMFKLLAFVGVRLEGRPEPMLLNSPTIIANHVISDFPWETLVKIEKEMMVYNCSFFQNGQAVTFFESIVQIALKWITKTWMPALARLLNTEKPHSTN